MLTLLAIYADIAYNKREAMQIEMQIKCKNSLDYANDSANGMRKSRSYVNANGMQENAGSHGMQTQTAHRRKEMEA